MGVPARTVIMDVASAATAGQRAAPLMPKQGVRQPGAQPGAHFRLALAVM